MSDLLKVVVKAMDERLAEDIVVLDFQNQSPFCDYFVIGSALNHRMAKSIIDRVEEKVIASGGSIRAIEGNEDSAWQLIDCNGIIAHVFVDGEREVYQLEKLWGDLPRVEVAI
ncbi:ribosome silencing factor [Anaerorhabdus sp.]|uniref:Ribosomal silencing factor RsfS n=1 Tax=bioreactor metagenome TaxID=1076179 RepID=A0A645EIZ5_9ZZZZ|nr:ribosome silencing factor [Anaerorhabdus sp.]MEA4876130.1 ribosome silencing factor [Anaerorhabdus sp.]